MSQNVDSREDISQHENRKRKLDGIDSHDDVKKPKLNASLGLSLLQAYDEEEQYSDEEDFQLKDDEVFESKCSEITVVEEEEEFVLADDGLASDEIVSCSLEENDALNSSSVDTKEVIVNEEITNVIKTNEGENISSLGLKNDEITLDRLDNGKLEEVKDENKNETKELVPDTYDSEIPSLELAAVCTKETIENSSKAIRLDLDLPVNADPKPVRKVKLNRSKFVQPVDESINTTRISPPKSDLTVSDKISSVSDVPQNKIKLPELENSSAKTENPAVTVEKRVATTKNVVEESIEEFGIQGTTKEVDIEKTTINHSHEEVTEEVNIERVTEDVSFVETTTEISIEETTEEISIKETAIVVPIEETAKEVEETTEEISIEKTAMVAAREETTKEVSIVEISKENYIEETTKEVSVVGTTKEIDIEGTTKEVCVEETKKEIDDKDTTKEICVEGTTEEVSIKEAIEEMSTTPEMIEDKNRHSMTEELKVTGKTCSVLLTPLICKDSKIVQLGDEIDNVQLSTPCQVKIPQLESVKSTKPERTSLRTSLKLKSDAGILRNKSVNKDSSSTKGSNSVTMSGTNKELSGVNEETKITVKDSSKEISDIKDSGIMEESEDLENSRIRDSKNGKYVAKETTESLKEVEKVVGIESGELSKSEIPKNPIKVTSEVICVTPDGKEHNLATETVEKRQDRTIHKPIPSKSKSVEISKLEQALTGRIENVQSHMSKEDRHSFLQKRTSGTELEPAQEDTKQNIKLHLSVQGDRVSIKNTHSVSKMSAGNPVRVKRQYRKREKVPGELEAKQASAKEYANRLRQRAERETPGAKKRGRKKKNLDAQPTEIILDPETDSSPVKLPEEVVPSLKVAINKLPSRKSSVAGKVQPIKLKISKNANVTIECTSKYDVCSADKEGNKNSINVNEKIVGILEEARKKDAPPPSCVETVPTAWSGPDLQRVERLLKESNITITPVATGHEVNQQASSVLKPILNSKEKFGSQVTFMEVESKTPPFPRPMNEEDDLSVNTSFRAGFQERPIPMNAAKSPVNETNIPSPSNVSATNLVDVKSEIRKKIASVEKRKQEIHLPEIHPVSLSLPKTVVSSPDILSPSTDIFSTENPCLEDIVPSTDLDNSDIITPESLPTFTPLILKSPVPATASVTKLSKLPSELFPKKRGRPTKAMVAAREAYRQQQEEFEKQKKDHNYVPGEMEIPSDISLLSTPTVEPLKIVKRGRKPKHERLEKKDSDDLSYEESPFDPAREAEELRRVEEERVKKEEERERKNEIRRIKAKERSDLVKAKRLRQKMKAKERHKLAKELRRLQQEEKKKLEEQLKRLPVSMGFDDETRMSAENSQAANMSFSIGVADDDSSGATNDIMSQKLKKSRMEIADSDSKDLMVDQVAEYQWPIQGGELYMIQEQVSNFLGVKSFKRKYPDIWRRPVDSEERAYLVDSGLVSETLCDLGITAVRSAELLDIMCSDFPEKYEEFRRYMRDKQMKELSFKQRAWANGLGYKLLMADGSKQDMKKRAMESVSNWNSALNKSRIEDRRCHMDLQTFIIHHPKQRGMKMTVPSPKVGSYPVTILPGQFCDFYKEYTPTELRYLPVNTVLYGPLKHPTAILNDDASQTDSDDSSSSDDSSTTSEDTQATEETLEEDIDKDLGLDVNTTKFEDKDSSFMGDEEQPQKETDNDRNLPSENDKSKILCKVCLGDQSRNKMNMPEVLISCSQCASTNHPTCLDLSLNVVSRIKSYAWQCPDCKICAQCKENADEDKMLFCDTCDRGYHIYCVGLIKVPAGNWQCKECTMLMAENRLNTAEIAVPKESHPNLIEITG